MSANQCMIGFIALALFGPLPTLPGQVHYHESGSPWTRTASSGPDAEVPGWFYNLGITGLRAQLVADEPRVLLIKYVFSKSPVDGLVQIDDRVIGVDGRLFQNDHQNGYGMNVFGAVGPISEFADALEAAQGANGKGKLKLILRRGDETKEVELDLGDKYGAFAPSYPANCPKSDLLLAEMLQYLIDHQAENGSFGNPVHNLFAPLALLASGEPKYLPAIERCVRHHCQTTSGDDRRITGLPNWRYMGAAILLSEYYLATKEEWVLSELQEVHDFLAASQYFPDESTRAYGGWGHNPGFEGYGPIAMITGQGALAYALMARCGIKIDRTRHDAAYDFLKRGTGSNGYVWYKDGVNGDGTGWADMGRTGAAGIANFLSPYAEPMHRERALLHSKLIGEHPQSFPDTHGSPAMGMGFTALAANIAPENFRALMDANRYWFTLAQCDDGSFYYQPNRDNAGYGPDARMTATATVAFIFTIPKQSLILTGKSTESHK